MKPINDLQPPKDGEFEQWVVSTLINMNNNIQNLADELNKSDKHFYNNFVSQETDRYCKARFFNSARSDDFHELIEKKMDNWWSRKVSKFTTKIIFGVLTGNGIITALIIWLFNNYVG